MKKLIFLFVCFISISLASFSQSAYLSKGQTGFGIGGGFSSNDQLTGFSSAIGLSISGVFDLGVSLSSLGIENSIYDATVVSPFATGFLVKQDETIPASLAFSGSYSRTFYSTEELKPSDIDLKETSFSIGLSLHSLINLTNSFGLQPFMGFSYNKGKVTTEMPETEDEFDGTVFSLGLSTVFRNTEKSVVVIEPQFAFSNNIRTFGLGLNYIFF